MSKFVSYLRVSTAKQGVSGLGLEAQRAAVAVHLKAVSGKLVDEVVEIESGTKSDRSQLAHALRLCRIHGAILLIAKLDRLARNVAFLSNLMEAGVQFTAVDMPEADRTQLQMMMVFAEHEARMISTRTKAALAAAKARGTKLGRRGTTIEELRAMAAKGTKVASEMRSAKAAKRRDDLLPVIEDVRQNGAETLREIAAVLNERGIPTARGGLWSAVQVLRVVSKETAIRQEVIA